MTTPSRTAHAELLQLKRWNTPTIYNGWEQITRHDPSAAGFNLEETRDYMPQTGQLKHLVLPTESAHVRVDTGVSQGDSISVLCPGRPAVQMSSAPGSWVVPRVAPVLPSTTVTRA